MEYALARFWSKNTYFRMPYLFKTYLLAGSEICDFMLAKEQKGKNVAGANIVSTAWSFNLVQTIQVLTTF